MNKEQAVKYLQFSGFSDEQIKAIEGAFTCEDCISREAVIDHICESKDCYKENCKGRLYKRCHDLEWVYELPSVNQFKPINCPSMGIDCEDCPAYEKKSEWQRDHEILKAYSDGASAVLDKVRAEMDGLLNDEDSNMYAHGVMDCLEIIDKFMAEGSEE